MKSPIIPFLFSIMTLLIAINVSMALHFRTQNDILRDIRDELRILRARP